MEVPSQRQWGRDRHRLLRRGEPGAFYANGRLFYNLLDGHTVALDAATGKEIWKTKVADLNRGETTPMAPLVVKDRVIVGTSGGEFGVRGWVKGLDTRTGNLVWTG